MRKPNANKKIAVCTKDIKRRWWWLRNAWTERIRREKKVDRSDVGDYRIHFIVCEFVCVWYAILYGYAFAESVEIQAHFSFYDSVFRVFSYALTLQFHVFPSDAFAKIHAFSYTNKYIGQAGEQASKSNAESVFFSLFLSLSSTSIGQRH